MNYLALMFTERHLNLKMIILTSFSFREYKYNLKNIINNIILQLIYSRIVQ